MGRAWLCLVLAACAGTSVRPPPHAERIWYTIASTSTLDGSPSRTDALDVSRSGTHVIISRAGSRSGATQGFGVRRADGTYDVAFYRYTEPPTPEIPRRPAPPDVTLVVVHPDGTGHRVTVDRRVAPIRRVGNEHDNELVIDAPGIGRARIRLQEDARATVSGALQGVAAVYGRIGDDTLIAISARGESSELSVGRYDFARGRGLNIGAHGSGTETFSAQRTIATE